MNTPQRILSLLSVSAAALLLAACDQSSPPTVGEKIDAGIERTQQAAVEAQKEAKVVGSELQKDASQAVNAMADGAADMAITAKVKTALASDSQLNAVAINVDTSNKVVTLTGPAPTQVAADRAVTMAKAVDGVTAVVNQLTVDSKS